MSYLAEQSLQMSILNRDDYFARNVEGPRATWSKFYTKRGATNWLRKRESLPEHSAIMLVAKATH